jgi:O-antigen/teichoic acid export membrane protein
MGTFMPWPAWSLESPTGRIYIIIYNVANLPGEIILTSASSPKGFMHGLASLAGGTAAGQAITVLASPIITRHFGPAELGAFSVFTTCALLLNATNSVRYEMGIPVAEDEERAGHLLWLCFLLVTGFSVLLGVAVGLWGAGFCRMVQAPSLAPCLWLLPLTTAAAGFYEALNYFAIRRKDFRALAEARIGQGVAQSGAQVVLGFARAGAPGLVVGDLLGRLLSSLQLAWGGRLSGVFRTFPMKGIRQAAIDHVRFPRFMACASILNLTTIQIPFLLIPIYFGAASAGHYFLAYRTLFMPASFIGGSISSVFLGEAAARARDGEDLKVITGRIFLLLAAACLPFYTVCAAGAGVVFPLAFGARWGEAGRIAQVLAPMTLVWSLARPISGMLLVRDRLKESLAFTAFELAAVMLALQLGRHTGSIHLAAVYIARACLLTSSLAVLRFLHAAGTPLGPAMARFFTLAALNVPLGLMVWWAARAGGPWTVLAVAAAGTAATALASLRFLKRENLL